MHQFPFWQTGTISCRDVLRITYGFTSFTKLKRTLQIQAILYYNCFHSPITETRAQHLLPWWCQCPPTQLPGLPQSQHAHLLLLTGRPSISICLSKSSNSVTTSSPFSSWCSLTRVWRSITFGTNYFRLGSLEKLQDGDLHSETLLGHYLRISTWGAKKRSIIWQREKLGCSSSTKRHQLTPWGSLQLGWALQSYPKLRYQSLAFIPLTGC